MAKRISKYDSSRDDLIEYITERKARAGILAGFSDADIKKWAISRDWDFLWGVCNGLWKDELDTAGFRV